MIPRRKPLLLIWLLPTLLLIVLVQGSMPVRASGGPLSPMASPGEIRADVSDASGSVPHLDAAGTAWETFDTAQAAPTKGGIVVVYTPDDIADLIAFPIQTTGATVTLRPHTAGPTLTCTQVMSEPQLTQANAGQCFFRVPGEGDRIHIYYMGQLEEGGNIRYTISGLTPAAGSGVFENFDSDLVLPDTPPSPIAGRIPARLVLVLDKSGSMKWSSHPMDQGCGDYVSVNPWDPCGPSRWEVLNQAVHAMLTLADAYLLPGDTVAVATFDSNVLPAETVPLIDLDHTAVNSIRDLVDGVTGLTPGGSTSIGAGLEYFEAHVQPVAPKTRNQYVLLFTDGDQNTAPYVTFSDNRLKINQTQNDPALGGPIDPYADDGDPSTEDVRVCPFALRSDNPGDPLGTQFNEDIAQRRCTGVSFTSVSVDPAEPDLIQYFLEILEATLIGDKLELSAIQGGQIVPGGEEGAVHEFVVSRDDSAFTVLINWAERGNGLWLLALVKDDVLFPIIHSDYGYGFMGGYISAITLLPGPPQFALVETGDSYAAVTLRRPFCNHAGECVDGEGEWLLGMVPFFEVSETFSYNVFTTTDNQTLASEFHATQSLPGVGQPLTLEAVLTEDGTPLTGLPDGSVTAVVARPGAGLGNVLSDADIDPLDNPVGDTIGSAGRKALAMLADPAHRDAILAALEAGVIQELTLTEDTPGVYTANYENTGVEGAYEVKFFVDAETPENGRFTRTFALTRYVPVVPDQDTTGETAAISSIVPCPHPGGCYAIDVKPEDSAGNLLGPGKASLFSLPEFDGVLLEPVSDNLDGTYTIKVGYPAGVTEQPTIDIYGVEIAPEVKPTSPIDGILDWVCTNARLVLLLILLLLLIIIGFLIREWRWRRPTKTR